MYPVKNQRWCQFHTQLPQYYPVENNRYLYYPIGKVILNLIGAVYVLMCIVFILGMKSIPIAFLVYLIVFKRARNVKSHPGEDKNSNPKSKWLFSRAPIRKTLEEGKIKNVSYVIKIKVL